MMRFMMMVKADRDYEAGAPPDPKLMAAMGEYTEKMIKAGVVLQTGGLLPSAKARASARLAASLVVTDGPFTETKELIGGYAIVTRRLEGRGDRAGLRIHDAAHAGAWRRRGKASWRSVSSPISVREISDGLRRDLTPASASVRPEAARARDRPSRPRVP